MYALLRDPRRVVLLCSLALAALLALATGPVAPARADYDSAVRADAPASRWQLNDATTTSAPDSAVGGTRTLTGITTYGTITTNVTGPFAGSKGVALNGGYYTGTYFNKTDNFAIELWARSNRASGLQAIASNGWVGNTANNRCWNGAVLAAMSADAHAWDNTTCYNVGNTGGGTNVFASATDWHHLVFQRTAGTTTLFVDGNPRGGQDTHTITLSGGSFRIGSWQDPWNAGGIGDSGGSFGQFTGAVSNVAFYDKALSAARIAAHFNATIGLPSNTTAPTASPTTAIGPGSRLRATTGQWTGAGLTYAYQWQRCDADGTGCTAIAGADKSIYTATADDAGHLLRVRVTATSSEGDTSAASTATAAVSASTPYGQALYGQTVLGDSPLGYWPLDDVTLDTAADLTGHGYTLTRQGTVTPGTAGPWPGATSARFTGAGDLSRPYFNNPNDFAIEFWAHSDRYVAREAMVSNGWVTWQGANRCWYGVIVGTDQTTANTSSNLFGFDAAGCSAASSLGNTAGFPTAQTWHHVVVQRTAGLTSMFVDGAQRGGSTDRTPTLNGGTFRVGGWQDATQSGGIGTSDSFTRFHGDVSNVAFYGQALSAAQIRAHYGAGVGVPAVLTRPSVTPSGAVYEGDTLTADRGTWAGAGTLSYTYQWQSCTTESSCAPIAGATSGTYTLTAAETGKTIKVVVTATNSLGASTSTSPATTTVRAGIPVATAPPVISGTTADGRTLTATDGTWTGASTITTTRQWQRCDADGTGCADIAGATGSSYTSTSTDVGHTLRVVATATNALGSTTATSAATDPVVAVAPQPTTAPQVSGTATDLTTLTSTLGEWTGTTPIAYARQWQRCNAEGSDCADITNATSDTYTLTSTDVGHPVRIVVTATNVAGTASKASAPTTAVSGIAPSNATAPVISGDTTAGATLSATAGTWTGTTPMTYTYQWQRCNTGGIGCNDIADATSNTYTLTATDVDHTIRAVVTATNVAGSTTKTTAATAVVVAVVPSVTSLPTISGTAVNYNTLTATDGTWSGTTPMTYARQWQLCNVDLWCWDIPGATGSSYTLTSTAFQYRVRVVVTATNVKGSATMVSEPTAEVAAAPPRNLTAPTLAFGDAYEGGDKLTTTGTWEATSPITYTYQWQLCDADGANCADISGAAAKEPSFYATSAYVGHRLRAVVTATSAAGSTSKAGELTPVILSARPFNTSPPTISGQPRANTALTASPGAWSGQPTFSYSYQWRRCNAGGTGCVNISGATGTTYMLDSNDIDQTVRVVVTALNPGGTATATSAPTAEIRSAAD